MGRNTYKREAPSKGIGIVKVAKQAKEIIEHLADIGLDCSRCNGVSYAPLDKLYIKAYGYCITCTPEDKEEVQFDNILEIVETCL